MDTFLSLHGVACTLSVRACVARRIFANSKTSREIWERRTRKGGGGEVYPLFSKNSFFKTNLFQLLTLLLLLLLYTTAQQKQTVVTTVARLTPKEAKRQQRHRKIRSRLTGTADRPRISVYRSNQHVFVQVIDDDAQKTLVSLGTQSQEVKAVVGSEEWKTKTVAAASELGKMLGKKCVDAGITSAVFDRGGFLYHGRVKAVADGCREAGVAI